MISILQQQIRSLPTTSGVYLMKDAQGNVIYVGKAIDLRKRVASYFRANPAHVRTKLLVENIVSIDHIPTHSEAEALILEASLVKTYDPKYNVELKDSKSYPYIQITAEAFPLVSVIRLAKPDRKEKDVEYFGPYTDAGAIREALTLLRKIFPFRTCEPFTDKLCLYHDIGLCEGPCENKVTQEDYARNIHNIRLVLSGQKDELYRALNEQMQELSHLKRFEEAGKVRDQMRAIGALYSSSPDVNYFKEAEQLERALKLPRRPQRIECIDISHTYGGQSVGSLVSFFNGSPDKKNYRRFRIKDVAGIDDFKMIAEVVRRRYGRLKREGAAFPELIVIDGGKGQLSAACQELDTLKVEIPIISLAKREEEVFLPQRRSAVVLSRDSLALKLLQRLRDEAHRFAIAYHRKLRGKDFLDKNSLSVSRR